MTFTRFRWLREYKINASNCAPCVAVHAMENIEFLYFDLFIDSSVAASYFFATLFPPPDASLLFFHVARVVLPTVRRYWIFITPDYLSFLLSAIPYWLMYPSVSSCSRFLFIVSCRTFYIPGRLSARFLFSLRIRLLSHFSILPVRNTPDTGPIMNIQILDETRGRRVAARRTVQKFKSDGPSDTRCRKLDCLKISDQRLISNRTTYCTDHNKAGLFEPPYLR